jgi:hypothetical protein
MLGVPAPRVAMTQADWRAANRLDRLDLISARSDAAAGEGAQPDDLGGTFNPFSSAGMIARCRDPCGRGRSLADDCCAEPNGDTDVS